MTGVLQWMGISPSEETGKEEGVVAWFFVREYFDVVDLGAGNDKVESLWEITWHHMVRNLGDQA